MRNFLLLSAILIPALANAKSITINGTAQESIGVSSVEGYLALTNREVKDVEFKVSVVPVYIGSAQNLSTYYVVVSHNGCKADSCNEQMVFKIPGFYGNPEGVYARKIQNTETYSVAVIGTQVELDQDSKDTRAKKKALLKVTVNANGIDAKADLTFVDP